MELSVVCSLVTRLICLGFTEAGGGDKLALGTLGFTEDTIGSKVSCLLDATFFQIFNGLNDQFSVSEFNADIFQVIIFKQHERFHRLDSVL